eukprot:jgi/Chlat1/8348/Chrsp80S07896
MALHPMNRVKCYWSRGSHGALTYPDVERFTKLERFEQIKRYFHLNDNRCGPYDKQSREYKLWHILPIIGVLTKNFKKWYRCGKELIVDERTTPIKNRMCPVRIYNPINDANTYYCHDFIIYDKLKCPDLHTVVVQQLLAELLGQQHDIYLDRGFTSPKLLLWIKAHGHNATGTIVTNRKGYPAHLLSLPPRCTQGTTVCAISPSSGLIAVQWMDKRPVNFLSTSHGVAMSSVSRLQSDGHRVGVDCPSIAIQYNSYKDAVDYTQQTSVALKWWHRAFRGLFDGAVTNAWIIYNHAHPDAAHIDFIIELQGQSWTTYPTGRYTGKHFPTPHPSRQQRYCLVCAADMRGTGARGKRSLFWCEQCGVRLCNPGCFRCYHVERNIHGLDVGPKRIRFTSVG